MSLLSFLKPKNQEPIPPGHRCQHRYDNRSRCRLPIDEASEFFCHRHLDSGVLPEPPLTPEQREAQLLRLYEEVMGGAKFLNSATAVNHVLDNLFRLTILGRIPQRIASKLTTQLRASLTSIRMKRDEFRVSQDDIETLLSDIDSHRESLESQQNEPEGESESSELAATGTDGVSQAETQNPTTTPNRTHVATHSSLHRDSESGRTCAASSNFNNESRPGVPQPRQIELLKQEANRPDRDPFFDFLPRADSPTDTHNAAPAAPATNAPAWDLPEFSDLRAAESRRRVADLVKGVWIGPKPNEINWDQLEQQIEYAEQINPTPFRRRRSRWWPAT